MDGGEHGRRSTQAAGGGVLGTAGLWLGEGFVEGDGRGGGWLWKGLG